MVHIYNGILLNQKKKEESTANWSNMDGPRDCHTEWIMSNTVREILYDNACVWILKKKKTINEHTNQKSSHRCRKQTYGYQRVRGPGINWKIGIDVCTLL